MVWVVPGIWYYQEGRKTEVSDIIRYNAWHRVGIQ